MSTFVNFIVKVPLCPLDLQHVYSRATAFNWYFVITRNNYAVSIHNLIFIYYMLSLLFCILTMLMPF